MRLTAQAVSRAGPWKPLTNLHPARGRCLRSPAGSQLTSGAAGRCSRCVSASESFISSRSRREAQGGRAQGSARPSDRAQAAAGCPQPPRLPKPSRSGSSQPCHEGGCVSSAAIRALLPAHRARRRARALSLLHTSPKRAKRSQLCWLLLRNQAGDDSFARRTSATPPGHSLAARKALGEERRLSRI